MSLPREVHCVPLPTGLPVGPVNAYLIDGDPITLVDTGLKSDESWQALQHHLAQTGHTVADVRQILITHGHVDHAGQAARIVAAQKTEGLTPAQVYIHTGDLERVSDYDAYMEARADAYVRVARESGVSQSGLMLPSPSMIIRYFRGMGESLESVVGINDGTSFNTGIGPLEAVWTPGHSFGSTCYVSREHGLLFSGDHVLSDISSNPSIDFDSFQDIAMLVYLRSLERLREFDGYTVLPGHRDIIRRLVSRIDELIDDYERKFDQARQALRPTPLSVYQMSRVLYGDYGFGQMILALAETNDILKVLERRGQARLEVKSGVLTARLPDTV
ncbi:MAG: MBL fold metallo-hydrolase [Candidatus Thorarchaeota archaeon]|nr:MBL fold metallo-hydrolase [Candidatus Thorarchaeota archaeon]